MKSRKLEFKTYELVIILLAICIFSTLTGCLVGYKLLTNKTLSKNYSLVDEDLEHFINEYNEIKKTIMVHLILKKYYLMPFLQSLTL